MTLNYKDLSITAGISSTITFPIDDDTGLPIILTGTYIVLEVFNEARELEFSLRSDESDSFTLFGADTYLLKEGNYFYRTVLVTENGPMLKSWQGYMHVSEPPFWWDSVQPPSEGP